MVFKHVFHRLPSFQKKLKKAGGNAAKGAKASGVKSTTKAAPIKKWGCDFGSFFESKHLRGIANTDQDGFSA